MNTFLAVDNDGVYRMSAQRIADPVAFFQKLVAEEPRVIRYVARIPGCPEALWDAIGASLRHLCEAYGHGQNDPLPVNMAVTQTWTAVAVRLPFIRLSTWFAPIVTTSGSVIIVPVYKQTAAPTAMKQTLYWSPQLAFNNVSTTLSYVFVRTSSGDRINCLTLSNDSASDRVIFYQVPVANVFPDGTICMGSSYNPPRSQSLSEDLQASLTHFLLTDSNADLMNGNEGDPSRYRKSQQVFRWDPDGEQLESELKLSELTAINSVYFAAI